MPQRNEVLKYRQSREAQLRESLLQTILAQLEEHSITLVELTEYYRSKYSARITGNAVFNQRSRKKRQEININAVNTRWKRAYDFLEGSSTYADRLKAMTEGQEVPEINVETMASPPEPEFVPTPVEVPSELDIALGGL